MPGAKIWFAKRVIPDRPSLVQLATYRPGEDVNNCLVPALSIFQLCVSEVKA